MEKVTMSRKEINQIPVFERLKNKEISQVTAGVMLRLTPRQISNKLKRYLQFGAAGLAHKRRGAKGNRAWSENIREEALALIREHYADFGPTFAAEKLQQNHAITINRESLRGAMIQAGMWHGKKRKSVHRQRRERKLMIGVMIQLDGSDHDWFEGRGPRCTLLVFIDDATSTIVWAEFVTGESVQCLMQASYHYFKKHGLPLSFYVDRASVFRVNTNNPDNLKITQYKRAMNELDIELKFARTPQAKGRVERVHRTLQDRLVKEMRLAGISDMDAANRFLHTRYLDEHNAKFFVPAANSADGHRPVNGVDLSHILCIKSVRVVTNDFTVSYKNNILQVVRTPNVILRSTDRITVLELLDQTIVLKFKGRPLSFVKINARPLKPKLERTYVETYTKPAQNHPWRRYESKETKSQKSTQMEVI